MIVRSMKKQVSFKSLPPTQLITVIGMNDYFGDDDYPQVNEEVTKQEFCENLDQLSFEDWLNGSGDGGENYVAVTIIDGSIHTIIP